MYAKNIKVEIGNKATDWTPAPEDTDASITAVDNKFASYSTTTQMNSAIELAKNEINLSVSQTYATKDNVSGIESRLSTAEGSITAHASEIALMVKESDVTGNYLIGKINLSSTTATIAAKHINLSGAVTISALATDAKSQLDTATANASAALDDAAAAQTTASTALTNAAAAQSTADTAVTNASAAQSTANTANARATYHYGTCATAAATKAKVVTLSGFVLYTGAKVSIKFTYANTVASPTLNINSTGAKTIRANNAALTASSKYNWRAGSIVNFVYDGTYWVMEESTANYLWASNSDVTKIDGGNIYTGSIKAAQIDVDDLFAQNITAMNMKLTEGCSIRGLAIGYSDSDGSVVSEISLVMPSGRGSIMYDVCTYDDDYSLSPWPAYFLRIHESIGAIQTDYFSVSGTGDLIASSVETTAGVNLDELNTKWTSYETLSSSSGWFKCFGYTFARFDGIVASNITNCPVGYRPQSKLWESCLVQNTGTGGYYPGWLGISTDGSITVYATSSYGNTSFVNCKTSSFKVYGNIMFCNR